MAFNNSLTIGAKTFERLEDGKFINAATTVDEPEYFILKSTPKQVGNSSYLIRFEKSKNNSTVGSEDDVLSVHCVVNVNLKAFAQADVEALYASLNSFLVTANWTKLLRGER